MDEKFSEFREFGESDKCINWAQFKDPLCCVCLAGALVAPWALTQEVAGSNNLFKI